MKMTYKYKFILTLWDNQVLLKRRRWGFKTKVIDFINPIEFRDKHSRKESERFIQLEGMPTLYAEVTNYRDYEEVNMWQLKEIPKDKFNEEVKRYRKGLENLSEGSLEEDKELVLKKEF